MVNIITVAIALTSTMIVVTNSCPHPGTTPPISTTSTSSIASASPTCNAEGSVLVPLPRPGNFFINDDFVKAHRVLWLPHAIPQSVNEFFNICDGQCAESGGIGGPLCISYFVSYGLPDFANLWPDTTFNGAEWMCQGFNATLMTSLYQPANLNGTWQNATGFNLCNGY